MAIRGGSAGGWTTLAALTGTDFFTAGASYYGVAELIEFAEDTHDFESRYLDGLIGPLPAGAGRVRGAGAAVARGPAVLPGAAAAGAGGPGRAAVAVGAVRGALARKGIPHAYLAFEGEQHGFRRAETMVAALEAELSFYGQVFGFNPPGVPVLPLS